MTGAELLGTAGVSLLLIAFALNLLKKLESDSTLYLLLNMAGAGIACLSSYLIAFWPFVVLEAVWTISSLMILINVRRKQRH
jgi:hypothetical protein